MRGKCFMQHNPAELLLIKAEADLRALHGMQDATVFDDSIFGFHAQQAVEKALKAWLELLNVSYPKTHDLNRLIKLLSKQGVETEKLYELDIFIPYAVQLRYDVIEIDTPGLERAAAISIVESLLFLVDALIRQ